MKKYNVIAAILLAFVSITAFGNGLISKSPDNASVYFISPQNGETVEGKVKVKFGLKGMGVAPANINVENTGHHHLLINMDMSKVDLSKPLPASEQIVHFGGGQTETVLELPKGKHTLRLLLGNYVHIPHDKPVMSKEITIRVK